MRFVSLASLLSLLQACAASQGRSPVPVSPQPLAFSISYEATTARVNVAAARPGYLIAIEQSSDGLFSLLPVRVEGSADSAPITYSISIARSFALSPSPLPPPPNPPCWESRATDTGTQSVWTGFCGLSPSSATASRRATSRASGFAPLPDRHRVIVLQLSRPIPSQVVEALLDSLPWSISPETIAEQFRSRLLLTQPALAWIRIPPRARD